MVCGKRQYGGGCGLRIQENVRVRVKSGFLKAVNLVNLLKVGKTKILYRKRIAIKNKKR